MSARRTHRDRRRRDLGQNFLSPASARHFVGQANVTSDDVIVEIGAGLGTVTAELSGRGARILAVEADPEWSRRLRHRFKTAPNVRVVSKNFFDVRLPKHAFRVIGNLPFSQTTDILKRLLDDPASQMLRADVIIQWDVARKRAAVPPTTLLSTSWVPWWELRLLDKIPATAFRPKPKVDAGILSITRRTPPLLPPDMATDYAEFVRSRWPFSQ